MKAVADTDARSSETVSMSKARKLEPIGWKSALTVLSINLVRGGNQVALKFALTALPPFWTAFGRMSFGALSVGAWAALRGIPLTPHRREWPELLNLGVVFAIQIALMHYGADYTSPAYATVLMNANPIFANLLAHYVVPGDQLSWPRVGGLTVAFGGICGIFLGRPDSRLAPNPIVGNLLLLVSAALVGARTVYTQRLVQRIQPEKTAFWQMVISLPFFLVGTLFDSESGREPLGWIPIAAIMYQGIIVGGAGFTLWARLLRRHSPSALTMFTFTVPVFGVVLSAWILSEAVTPRLILGVAAVVSGILIATRLSHPRLGA